jgi:hypothetical protein
MTSYGGIIRIRLKGRSSVTSSQPASQAPLYLFIMLLYTRFYKIQGGLWKMLARKTEPIKYLLCVCSLQHSLARNNLIHLEFDSRLAYQRDSLKGCLFFCQSILAKTVKTPNFPQSNGELGAFCVY